MDVIGCYSRRSSRLHGRKIRKKDKEAVKNKKVKKRQKIPKKKRK